MCSDVMRAELGYFLQLKAAVTPPSSPQHLCQLYFHFFPLWVYHLTLASLGNMCAYMKCPASWVCAGMIWMWERVHVIVHVILMLLKKNMHAHMNTQTVRVSYWPALWSAFPQWARQLLCLLHTLITLFNHCRAAKVKDTSVSLCSCSVIIGWQSSSSRFPLRVQWETSGVVCEVFLLYIPDNRPDLS